MPNFQQPVTLFYATILALALRYGADRYGTLRCRLFYVTSFANGKILALRYRLQHQRRRDQLTAVYTVCPVML